MAALHRHQLARLTSAGWAALLAGAPQGPQGPAHDCLAHWAHHQWPLVVTRQAPDTSAASPLASPLALGLPAPSRWGRLRLALAVPRGAVASFGEFPLLADVLAGAQTGVQPSLPRAALPALRHLLVSLAACGTRARVYGSHGWQAITGLDHVRPGSDLDLWLAVAHPAQADAVTQRLHAFDEPTLRVDGELVFADGTAVAWREWAAWRAGRTRAVLAKRLNTVALLRDPVDGVSEASRAGEAA